MRYLRGIVITWTIITTTFFWTTTMRLFFKPEISDWSIFGFSGRGLTGDYWFPLLIIIFSLFIFFLEGRGRLRRLFHGLLLVWHIGLTLGVILGSLQPDSNITFGAWGINISLAWLIFPLVLFTVLTIIHIIIEIQGKVTIPILPWNHVNWKTLGLILALFPISFLLFFYGKEFNLLIKLAIVVNIIQWILLSEALGRQQKAI